jgi:pimeloyl-ACP methyl ester carboxylesterase
VAHRVETVRVGGTPVQVLRGGSGRPVVVLHGIEGPEGWLAFHEALAREADVWAPSHPGYGETPRPDWMESITHTAQFYGWFLQEAGLEQVDLVGVGVGGWIAAEMAVMNPSVLHRLVLVDAVGVHPREGEIADVFVVPWGEVLRRGFADADASTEYQRVYSERPLQDFGGERESGRSMAMRTCYKPYMHNPALPPLLGRVKTPSLVVWGAQDEIVPLDCGQLYVESLVDARLEVIENCGHMAHFERPDELASLVRGFVAK